VESYNTTKIVENATVVLTNHELGLLARTCAPPNATSKVQGRQAQNKRPEQLNFRMTTTMSNSIPVGTQDVAGKMAEIISPKSQLSNRYRGVRTQLFLHFTHRTVTNKTPPGHRRRPRPSLRTLLPSHRSNPTRAPLSFRTRLHTSHRHLSRDARSARIPLYSKSPGIT
jgi:hypothetical protein